MLYFSLQGSATVQGTSLANEDIGYLDTAGDIQVLFDGSDVGLDTFSVDAFALISENELLMSFSTSGSVQGVSGTVDDSDIVLFTATSLGPDTAGTFELYFDGSDVGLSSSGEDVDAVELLPNGNLLVSTTGGASVPGVSAADEDLLEFAPSSLGSATAGSWSLYFDGSDVGLSSSSEDVNAVAVDGGTIYLSTSGSFSTNGLSGTDEDVFIFVPVSLGTFTSGTFPGLFFDGSAYGLSRNDIYAIDLP